MVKLEKGNSVTNKDKNLLSNIYNSMFSNLKMSNVLSCVYFPTFRSSLSRDIYF